MLKGMEKQERDVKEYQPFSSSHLQAEKLPEGRTGGGGMGPGDPTSFFSVPKMLTIRPGPAACLP